MSNPLLPCPDPPNCFQATISIPAAAELVRKAIEQGIRKHRGLLLGKAESVSTDDLEIRAVFRIGPFRDDLSAVVEEEEGGTSVLHIRSASRSGYFD